MTRAELEAAEKLCSEATSEPWVADDPPGGSVRAGSHQVALACGAAAMYDERASTAEIQRANATFIAWARTGVPMLVAEVRRLRVQYARFVKSMFMNAGGPPQANEYAQAHGFEDWAEVEEEAKEEKRR